MKKVIILLVMLILAPSSYAWDGSYYNKNVNLIQMDSAYIFVSLIDVPKLCTGGNIWGILKHDNQAHRNMLSVLLSAKISGKIVDVHSNACTVPAGYCCIGNIMIRN